VPHVRDVSVLSRQIVGLEQSARRTGAYVHAPREFFHVYAPVKGTRSEMKGIGPRAEGRLW